jgi:hypothetical protein
LIDISLSLGTILALVHWVFSNACEYYFFLLDTADVPHSWAYSIGAAVLSHHVDSFALVSAFFLFSIGCLNILVGLIWREKAKDKRSILTWRDQKKNVLPKYISSPKIPSSPPSFVTTTWTGSERSDHSSEHSKGGLGFGRQGEKAAGYQGGIALFRRLHV